jgi:hypothetical protein
LIIRTQLGNGFENRQLVQTVPFPLNEPGLHFPFHSLDKSAVVKSLLDSFFTSTDPLSFIQKFQAINEELKFHNSLSQHFMSLDPLENIAPLTRNNTETLLSIDRLQFKSENVTRNTTSDCLIFFLYSDEEANISVGALLENGTAEGVPTLFFPPISFGLSSFHFILFSDLLSSTVTWRDSSIQLYALQRHCDFCSVCTPFENLVSFSLQLSLTLFFHGLQLLFTS